MEHFHLTTPQQNIWNLQKYYGDTAIANLCGVMLFQERKDLAILQEAVRQFIRSQSGIRLRFCEEKEPVQYVSEEIEETVSVLSFGTGEELDRYAEDFARKPIGLTDRPMYRFAVFHLEDEDRSGILVTLSHLISDAWTFGLMAEQIDVAYQNLAGETDISPVEGDYVDFIRSEGQYFASERYGKDQSYWEEKYTVRPEATPVKLCQMPVNSVEARRVTRTLPAELEQNIATYCKNRPVTQAVLFETALILYLSRINPENQTVTVGVPVLNRSGAKEKAIAGMFVSTMPLTVSVWPDMEILDLAGQIAKGHMNLFRHQKYPYGDILRSLREKQDFSGNLYDVMISYQNARTKTGADTKWYSNGYSEVPLVIHIDNRDGKDCHTINVDYQTAVFRDEEEIGFLIERLEYILGQIVGEKGKTIGNIGIVPPREYKKVVHEFNDTYVEYPREKCVHELFTEQAAKTPGRIALVFEDQKFTYRELDEMSNSLAHFLREKGIGRGDIVPIIARRSWHVIVAMLGILKAGGAYMPVSPEFPLSRIQYMLETVDAKFAVVYGYPDDNMCLDKCHINTEILSLKEIDYSTEKSPLQNENELEDPCYVIFTSGSTGEPKGVVINHRNTSNYCHNNNNNNNVCHKVVSDRNRSIVSVTNIVFDIFVTESLLPLVNGLTIFLTNDNEAMSQEKLARLIKCNVIDVIQTTPTKMKSFMLQQDNLDYLSVLRTVILGGEALSEELYKEIAVHSKARIFNIYGPAETTVWSTNKEIRDERWLVHEQFERMAAMHPEAIALLAGNEKYTYRELDEKSNALAQKLIVYGIGEGMAVGAYLDRTAYTVISQLAVLKAGGIFQPIDHRYPKDRIEYMLEDCNTSLVISDEELGKEWNVPYINLNKYDFKDVLEKQVRSRPEAPCYIIYTSGSTGRPKGCLLKHAGVANFCVNNNIVSYAEKLDHQTVVSVNTISFDFFIAETLLPLAHGWTVVLASEEESNSKRLFKDLVIDNDVNIIETTPTRLEIYAKDENENSYLRQMQLIVSAGEILSDSLLEQLRRVSSAKIYNPLGPSECSVWNVDGNFKMDITIGTPIANTQIYILDGEQRPVPIGVPGELCIAGDGVGLGYLNCPRLTAERFIPNPFATLENHHGKTMYRTGDLARFRSDGEIEYLGRMDTQVKIRGLRIELGEIESVMGSFPGIGLCAVADKKDGTGRQYLVGYYTSEESVDEKALRSHLSAKLPKYMVPNYFLRLDAMPMTASGKTDRKNLPVPDFDLHEEEYIPPATATEERLALIWRRLLSVERVGRTDDFFELGGDSLLAISALNEIEREFLVEISIRDIMEQSSLERMALCIDHARDRGGSLTACHGDRYVLLPQQKAIYAACRKEPDTLLYNMPAKILLPPEVDRDRLLWSIRRVLERHKILKSCIREAGDEIYGVYDENAQVQFEEYRDGGEEKFVRAFDLGKAPLVHIGFTETALLFDMHHIIADGGSLQAILGDIASSYGGTGLRSAELWFGDYARYFQGSDFGEHRAYFKEMLKCEFEPVILPETRKPGQGGVSGIYFLPEDIFGRVRRFAKENGLTETMVFLGAYGILLSKYAGKKDILSSVILQNRTHADTRDMVGMFVNTLPVYLAVDGKLTDYMGRMRETVLDLMQYQELPFLEIAEAVGMADKSVVNTSFVYQGDGEKKLVLDGQDMLPQFMDTHTSKFDLSMELMPLDTGCRMRLEYDLAKYDEELADRLAESYIRILGQLDREEVADISVLSEEEYHRIVEEFNDTYVEYPREKCVHELFTEQAARTPERTALVFEDQKFTYRQLDEMSNSLAHFLRGKGVGRGDIVPIIARRSWHVVVAMLGILKAGGAYMPVDPEYPEDRISYMLSETKAKIMLVYEYRNNSAYETIDLAEVDYDRNRDQVENCNSDNDMCYVLYTSGSAGRPKAVCISHANMANFNNNNNNNHYQHAMLETCGTVLADTEFIFDISAFEIFLSLLNGLCLVLAKNVMDAPHLAGLIEKHHVDALHITPTKLLTLLHDRAFQKAIAQVKVLMAGAEVFTESLYQTVSKYTDAAIYNGYGPTETTIGCSFKKVVNEMGNGSDITITIGTPIANTQIYILDGDQRPVPIGVPGELCIAGEGVGLGYLNRPRLTAERFIPNPFARLENHHGKTMYRTGDLTRFRNDGEIEYLGRMDTQVKIRGLRIELGEIESVMGSFPGIGLCAVADKKDGTSRQYLVGYYTVAEEVYSKAEETMAAQQTIAGVDEKALRSHLSAKLPKYMVPNYFMRLDAMPMTASGKTDRKNLPVPDFTQQAGEYVPPATGREKVLCRLMEELLHVERAGVTDDFFELGGDSLTAIEFLAKAHDRGIDLALQNIFDYPTVRQLCDHLEAGEEERIQYELADFERYQGLLAGNVIDEAFVPERKSLGNVLLTGATGFLGAHVLDVLLREETGKVYCLVREGKNAGNGERSGCGERLRDTLRYYFGDRYEEEFAEEPRRIIPIAGDIESDPLAGDMPGDVQTVIHTAASVKHYGSYDYFRRVNVEGTRHVVNYAKSVGARLIHISTLSVSGNSLADAFDVYRSEEEKHFDETSFYIGQPLDNVYIHSKFEAERAVLDAMLAGLDAKIIRVGNLTSRASDYKFQPNYRENAFLTRCKAILEFGLFPEYLMPLYCEFSPIDLTAEGIVRIARYADRQTVFHLNSNRPIYFDRFLEVVRELGIPMKVVDGDSFNRALCGTIRDRVTEYIFEAFQNDMDGQGRLVYDSNIRIDNDFTVWFLKKAGFEWNEIDLEYIRGYVEYFRKIGYLGV